MRFMRPLMILFYDAIAAGAAFSGALLLRYDGDIPAAATSLLFYSFSYGAFCAIAFYLTGLHRNIWRYSSTRDLLQLAYTSFAVLMAHSMLLFVLTRLENFPRSAFVIIPLLHIAFASAPRIFMRLLHDRPFKHGLPKIGDKIDNVLLIDAGDSADLFIRECIRQHPKQYNILGILDDEENKHGRNLHGIPVIASTISLPKVIESFAASKKPIDMLIMTNDRPSTMGALVQIASSRKIKIKRLPNIHQLQEGEKLTNLKSVLIEDILGRQAVETDMSDIESLLCDQSVLITGAGGSIGGELCRQVASRQPKILVLLDHSELALYQIDMEMQKYYSDVPRVKVLQDVKNRGEMDILCQKYQIDIIFHAAAYKHVPIVEDNPISGISNNFIGTMNVADSASHCGVKKLIIISTDKAVNPTNVMGATKRAAELYCQNLETKTEIITVRFGNVLGSTGSVVPLFNKQIESGGPLTVTHKDVTRYFMTIPEAVQLVLQASTLGKGREVFMLDMGQPIRIYDMAEEMIRLSGLIPHEDISIIEVGLRPGEKMFEELSYNPETMEKTSMDKIFLVAETKISADDLHTKTLKIKEALNHKDAMAAVCALRHLVEEYTPAQNSPYAKLIQ